MAVDCGPVKLVETQLSYLSAWIGYIKQLDNVEESLRKVGL